MTLLFVCKPLREMVQALAPHKLDFPTAIATVSRMITNPKLLKVKVTTVVPVVRNRTMLVRLYGEGFRDVPAFELDLQTAHQLAENIVQHGIRLTNAG